MRLTWLVPLILAVLIVGCGSDDGGDAGSVDAAETESRVFAREGLLSAEDLVSLGLKSGKTYDVATLPGGVEAGLLYWRVKKCRRGVRSTVSTVRTMMRWHSVLHRQKKEAAKTESSMWISRRTKRGSVTAGPYLITQGAH